MTNAKSAYTPEPSEHEYDNSDLGQRIFAVYVDNAHDINRYFKFWHNKGHRNSYDWLPPVLDLSSALISSNGFRKAKNISDNMFNKLPERVSWSDLQQYELLSQYINRNRDWFLDYCHKKDYDHTYPLYAKYVQRRDKAFQLYNRLMTQIYKLPFGRQYYYTTRDSFGVLVYVVRYVPSDLFYVYQNNRRQTFYPKLPHSGRNIRRNASSRTRVIPNRAMHSRMGIFD